MLWDIHVIEILLIAYCPSFLGYIVLGCLDGFDEHSNGLVFLFLLVSGNSCRFQEGQGEGHV